MALHTMRQPAEPLEWARYWQERALRAEADSRRMREALKTIKALQQGYLGGDDGRRAGYRICGALAEKGLGPRG